MPRSESAGLLFAIAGYLLLSVGDAVVKTMAGLWPPTAIAMLRYSLAAIGLAAIVTVREGPRGLIAPMPAIQLMRGFAVAMATLSFFSAVFLMPLGDATTIAFTSPMITALLAPLLLGEPFRREAWYAMLLAFGGVVIVLRPNFGELGWPAFLPLFSALGMSLLVIGNRVVAGKASPLAMQAFLALAAAPLCVAAALTGHFSGIPALTIDWPGWSVPTRCALVAVASSTAHWLIFLGTTRAGAATVAPMSYAQLIGATGLGWLLFGERPDGVALVGAALIVVAGVYLWRCGRRVAEG